MIPLPQRTGGDASRTANSQNDKLIGGPGVSIVASAIRLVDPKNSDIVRGMFGVSTQDDQAAFVLNDEQGKPRVQVTASSEYSGVEIMDPNAADPDESLRAWLSVVEGETVGLGLAGSKMANRVELYAAETGAAGVSLADKSGKFRGELSVSKDETAGVRLADTAGKMRSWMSVPAKGTVGLGLADRSGKPRARFTIQENGFILLGMDDKKGRPRTEMFLTNKGATGLDLYYRDGKRALELFSTTDNIAGTRMVDSSGEPLHYATVSAAGSSSYLWSETKFDPSEPQTITIG